MVNQELEIPLVQGAAIAPASNGASPANKWRGSSNNEEGEDKGALPNRAIIKQIQADDDVLSCTFSPKGKYLVYGHAQLTVVRTEDWEVVVELEGTDLDSVCFSKDSRLMAYMTAKQCIVIETDKWTVLKNIEVVGAGENPAHCCCFSGIGKKCRLTYGGETRALTMVSTATWETLKEFCIEEEIPEAPTGNYREVEWDPQERFLCFTHDHTLAVVFRGTSDVDYKFTGENINRPINLMAWSPQGELLSYCNWKTLTVVNTDGWEAEKELRANAEILTMAFNNSGDNLCYGGAEGTLTVVDTVSWAIVKILDMGGNSVLCCALTLDIAQQRSLMAYGGKSGRVDIVKVVSDWWAEATMLPQDNQINDSDFSPDGKYLAVCDEGGDCYILQNHTWEKLQEWTDKDESGKTYPCNFCCWNGQSSVMAYGGFRQYLTAVSAEDWSQIAEVNIGMQINAGAYADAGDFVALACGVDAAQLAKIDGVEPPPLVEVTPQIPTKDSGKSLGSQNQESKHGLVIVSTKTWEIEHIHYLEGMAMTVEVSPDREWLAVSGMDEKVTLIDIETKNVFKTITADDGIFVIRSSPAGDLMAFGGEDMKMNVYSTVTWEPVTPPLDTGGDWVWDCVFSPCGQYLCFVCKGLSEIIVVNTATWGVVRDLKRTVEDENDFSFYTCMFSPDSEYLVCGGSCAGEDFRTFMSFPVGILISKPPLRGAYALSGNPTDILITELEQDPTRILEVVEKLAEITPLNKLATMLKRYPYIVTLDYIGKRNALAENGDEDIAPLLKSFMDIRDRGNLIEVFKACHVQLGVVKSLSEELVYVCKVMPDIIVELLECMELPTVDRLHVKRYLKDAITETEDNIYVIKRQVETTKEEGVPAILQRTPSKSLGSLHLLEELSSKAPDDAFATPVMSLVVEGLWKQVQWIFMFGFLAHLAFTFSVVALAVQVANPQDYLAVWAGIIAAVVATSMLLVVLNGVEIWYLISGCVRNPMMFFSHLVKPWNLVDVVSPFVALIISFALFSEIMQNGGVGDGAIPHSTKIWVCLLVLMSTFALMQYLRGFPTFAPLVAMLAEIVTDMLPFMFLLLVIMVCFSFIFNIDMPSLAQDVKIGLFQTFVMGILADFDTEMFDDTQTATWFSKVIFMLMMIVVQLIMLNLLIAIMGSTYERVSDVQYTTLRAARARVVLKMLTLMSVFKSWYERFAERNDMVYSLVPIAAQGRKKQEAWSGHLNALKKHMDVRLQDQLEEFRTELFTIQEDVSQHAAMQEDLGDIKENLGLIMKHMRIKRD